MALEGLAVFSMLSRHLPGALLAKAVILIAAVTMAVLHVLPKQATRIHLPRIAGIMKPPLQVAVPVCLALTVAIFGVLHNRDFHPALVRYPPLNKLLGAFSYTLLGVREASARLPQLIFSLGAGIYLYKLVRLYRDERASILASAAFLFCPIVFYFGNLANMEPGVLFFCMASSYYFLKGLQESSSKDLAASFLFVTVGFFYKQPVAFCLIIFALHLLCRRGIHPALKVFHLKLSAVFIAAACPWLLIGSKYGWRNYVFSPSNWAQAQLAFKYGASGFSMGKDRALRSGSRWPS
ncbi:MAG: glycosyltransferase family 39 protein [Elusimicrobia bacterium]|nr:glycosyltransferase family 39 protein [Elusimicrobiota bacterium]